MIAGEQGAAAADAGEIEALAGVPDALKAAGETCAHTVEAGGYRAAPQLSTVDNCRYVDKRWRICRMSAPESGRSRSCTFGGRR